jgi:hypothetical protein
MDSGRWSNAARILRAKHVLQPCVQYPLLTAYTGLTYSVNVLLYTAGRARRSNSGRTTCWKDTHSLLCPAELLKVDAAWQIS